jgi:hypothetical protein
MVCKPHATPISRKIGTAFENAARISAENTLAEDVAIRAAVKLFEADGGTDNGKSDDGTDIPSVGLTPRITWTMFFWTVRRFRNYEGTNQSIQVPYQFRCK